MKLSTINRTTEDALTGVLIFCIAALLPAQFRYAAVRGGCRTSNCHEDSGPHGLPDHRQYLHAPQFGDDEEIQRGHGGSIPSQAGSQGRTVQGQEREGKKIEETGCGYQPAVGGKVLTDTMKAMTHNAPWPIFCVRWKFPQRKPWHKTKRSER